jgi:site-specific DNA recombinase
MRAAIYIRVSTEGQRENYSPETQEKACRSYCEQRGYEIDEAHVYREVFSGTRLYERPELERLRAATSQGLVQVVVAYSVDRLSRNQNHVGILMDEWKRQSVLMEFATEKFEDNAIGRFLISVQSFAAEFELEKFKERSMRGISGRVKSGKPRPGQKAPYGYVWRDVEKSGYALDPQTAPTVEWVFRAVAGGMSLRQITKRLNDQGIPSPMGREFWRASTIHVIVTNPIYVGRPAAFRTVRTKNEFGRPTMQYRPVDQRVPLPAGTAPPLVDASTFDLIQERLRLNKERCVRNSLDPEAALLRTGYAKCGYCGGSMVAQRSGKGGKYVNYRCGRGMESEETCRGASIPAATLDEVAWSRVSAVLLDPTIIGREVERMRRDDPTEADLARVDRLIAESKRQRERLMSHLARLDPDSAEMVYPQLEAISIRLRALAEEREGIALRRIAWEAAQDRLAELERWRATVAANMGDMTYQHKRLAFDALGVTARVYRADHEPRYEVEASIPLGSEGVVSNTR